MLVICCYSLFRCTSAYYSDNDASSDTSVEKSHQVVVVDEKSNISESHSSSEELDFYLWTQHEQCTYVFSLVFSFSTVI